MNLPLLSRRLGGPFRRARSLELLALLSADPTRPATMSYDEFLAWADEDTLAEWVDGRLVMTSPASAQHQYLAIFLATTLSTYVTIHDLGTVLTGPFQMKLARSGREPDVLFVAKEHLAAVRRVLRLGPSRAVEDVDEAAVVGRNRTVGARPAIVHGRRRRFANE